MARFNIDSMGSKTVNKAGGEAYTLDPESQLAMLVLTTFLKDQYYRKADDTEKELRALLTQVEPEFSAKLAVFARREYGLRSVSHLIGADMAHRASGRPWLSQFLYNLFKRPDDMLEIVAAYQMKTGKRPLANALKRAIRARLALLNEYGLAKYRGEGKQVKMVDLVNLTHPKSTPALEKLMKGELKSTDTWESRLTKAGQDATSAEHKEGLKEEAWRQLLEEGKLGYFALLRNLRNIIQQAPEMVAEARKQLVNREAIKRSLVLPFRFVTAMQEIKIVPHPYASAVLQALGEALDISTDNVPVFDGKTLIIQDISGSMQGDPARHASVFSAALMRANPTAELIVFGNHASYVPVNRADSLTTTANSLERMSGGGTDFKAPFRILKEHGRAYDRMIWLSDMQGWIGYNAPTAEFESYVKQVEKRPKVYSFDLQGYGTVQFPQSGIYLLAGWSEKVFDIMKVLETDPKGLVNEIKKVDLMADYADKGKKAARTPEAEP